MAKTKTEIILALDSGVLIAAERKNVYVAAVIRRWMLEGASFLIPAPAIAEAMRGGPRDAAANRVVKAIGDVSPTNERIARDAGSRLGQRKGLTIDALIVATSEAHGATDILTTDPGDIRALASDHVNVVTL